MGRDIDMDTVSLFPLFSFASMCERSNVTSSFFCFFSFLFFFGWMELPSPLLSLINTHICG